VRRRFGRHTNAAKGAEAGALHYRTVRGGAASPQVLLRRAGNRLGRSWYPIRAAVGLDTTRFHDLRHSCVTLLLELGVPPHIVRDIVGHADIGVAMTIYAHASLDESGRLSNGSMPG
jgi:integrase